VCGKAKNDFGLCDMIGNAWEWCAHLVRTVYYQDAAETNPAGPETGIYCVLRRGS
jgi:formylglycine-generating enzyme required for sulfatase activity